MFGGEHATLEEFVPGSFAKYVNNNGNCAPAPEDATQDFKDLVLKAETLVHYSYVVTDHKLMLLGIQGSAFTLYDLEIATAEIMDKEHHEIYFYVAIALVSLLQLFSQTMCAMNEHV